MLNIAVLVSGGGTNLQALLDAQENGGLKSGRVALVVSSKAGAYALQRAEAAGVDTAVLEKKGGETPEAYGQRLVALLKSHGIDVVVLAGFLLILDACVIRAYEGRIVNVHPSLIPSFCGEGYYGLKVHEAALDKGVKVTGATVHLVNEVPDGGRILAQKAVQVREGDTPETLQKRVMVEAEWILLPQEVEALCGRGTEGKRQPCGLYPEGVSDPKVGALTSGASALRSTATIKASGCAPAPHIDRVLRSNEGERHEEK